MLRDLRGRRSSGVVRIGSAPGGHASVGGLAIERDLPIVANGILRRGGGHHSVVNRRICRCGNAPDVQVVLGHEEMVHLEDPSVNPHADAPLQERRRFTQFAVLASRGIGDQDGREIICIGDQAECKSEPGLRMEAPTLGTWTEVSINFKS